MIGHGKRFSSGVGEGMPSGRKRNDYTVHSVERAFSILEMLRRSGEMRAIDVSQDLGVSKSVAFKILQTLLAMGYVVKNSETGRYRLGIQLFELGSGAVTQARGREELHKVLQSLVDETNETAHLSILQGAEVLYLDKVESRASLRMVTAIGLRRPAYCTGTGKSLLAWQPEDVVRRIMGGTTITRFTPRTITDIDGLLRELALVRERGYAVDDEENEPGIICIGAPLRNHEGTVTAAISIAGPSLRIPRERIPELAEKVVRASEEIHRTLGHVL